MNFHYSNIFNKPVFQKSTVPMLLKKKKPIPIECSPLPCVFVPPAGYTDYEFSRLLQTAVGDGAPVKPTFI